MVDAVERRFSKALLWLLMAPLLAAYLSLGGIRPFSFKGMLFGVLFPVATFAFALYPVCTGGLGAE